MIYNRETFGGSGIQTERVNYEPEGKRRYCFTLFKGSEEDVMSGVAKRDSEIVHKALLNNGWFKKNDAICREIYCRGDLMNAMALANTFGDYLFSARVKRTDFLTLAGVKSKEDESIDVQELFEAMEKDAKHVEERCLRVYNGAEMPTIMESQGFTESDKPLLI